VTTEEKRIKILNACGWNLCKVAISHGIQPENAWRKDGVQCVSKAPDVFNDLNAMHEAEKILRSDKWKWLAYVNSLNQIPSLQDEWLCSSLHATAAQRAEAFGRTLNLWTK